WSCVLPEVHNNLHLSVPLAAGGAVSLYSCPIYKKPRRTDPNFIFSLQLRSVQPPEHWTLRGAALLCDCKNEKY
uniref:Dynein heavy chain C-terminal domain-containing protein n=1 Tax=Maylandia zebra TaxID=106582 RepID=A0A3P9BUN8_9CICH